MSNELIFGVSPEKFRKRLKKDKDLEEYLGKLNIYLKTNSSEGIQPGTSRHTLMIYKIT